MAFTRRSYRRHFRNRHEYCHSLRRHHRTRRRRHLLRDG